VNAVAQHDGLFSLTRTVEASGSAASRTKLAAALPSASALAPLCIRGATRARIGTTAVGCLSHAHFPPQPELTASPLPRAG